MLPKWQLSLQNRLKIRGIFTQSCHFQAFKGELPFPTKEKLKRTKIANFQSVVSQRLYIQNTFQIRHLKAYDPYFLNPDMFFTFPQYTQISSTFEETLNFVFLKIFATSKYVKKHEN